MLAFSCEAFAQALPEAADTEEQYLALIEQMQESGDLTAPDLIEPLAALGEYYFQRQDFDRAADSFAHARQITRVNNGFNSPQELPLLARQVAAEQARGNVVEAWELEESLLELARQNIGSMEALPVFRAATARRLDIWNQYRSGAHPPEIELGCYYDRRAYIASFLLREPQSLLGPDFRRDCSSGERHTVIVSLLVDARRYLFQAVETLLQNGAYAGDEMREIMTELLRLSYDIQRRELRSSDPMLADLMARLLAYEPQDPAAFLRRAEFLLQLADMNIVRVRELRRLVGLDIVREQYVQAWSEFQNLGMEQARMEALFAPAIPVVLPAFNVNPLSRVTAAEATGYIDVSFEVTEKGLGRRVKVADSANVTSADVRELKRLIQSRSFRPRMADGAVLKTAPVSLRYYVKGEVPPEPNEDCEDSACESAG